jgi:hypothetical protein
MSQFIENPVVVTEVGNPTVVVAPVPTYRPAGKTSAVESCLYGDDGPEPNESQVVTGGSRIREIPNENGYADADIMGALEALEDGVAPVSHTLLEGKSIGTQAAMLYKSMFVYLSTHVDDYSDVSKWFAGLQKLIPHAHRDFLAMEALPLITFPDTYVWRQYLANMLKTVHNFGSCYNAALELTFVKTSDYIFTNPSLKMDLSLHPFYVSYSITSVGGSVTSYNPPLDFRTSTGQRFTEDQKYMYMYSYAMFFKYNAGKGVTFKPFEFPAMEGGRTATQMITLSSTVIRAVKQGWSCPSNYTTPAAFAHFIHWSLTANVAPGGYASALFPCVEGSTNWAAKKLYDHASQYYVSLTQQDGKYTTPKQILETCRAMRKGGVLDHEWCKDSTKLGAMTKLSAGPNAGKYVVGRSVVMKSLVTLDQIKQMKPDCVIYAGVANHNNYQASYAHDFLTSADIQFITFDIIQRSGVHVADATDPSQVAELYKAATTIGGDAAKSVVFMCDIDTTGLNNDNKKPMIIADTIIATCPDNIKLLAIYNKGTVFADLPMLNSAGFGSVFLRNDQDSIVTGRKHGGECVIITTPDLPNRKVLSPLHPRYLSSTLSVYTIELMRDIFESNLFRGIDMTVVPYMKGVPSQIEMKHKVITDYEFAFVPLPKKHEKAKAEQMPEFDVKGRSLIDAPCITKSKAGDLITVIFPETMTKEEYGEWLTCSELQFGFKFVAAGPRTFTSFFNNLTTSGKSYVQSMTS